MYIEGIFETTEKQYKERHSNTIDTNVIIKKKKKLKWRLGGSVG